MKRLSALAAGLLFGLGLAISGMTSPAKVIGFLDVTGRWDPSLALVMGGALAAAIPLYALARRRDGALDGAPLDEPMEHHIDRRLLGGAALFGVGWGLAGICPGPALVDLAARPLLTGAFVATMFAGLLVAKRA